METGHATAVQSGLRRAYAYSRVSTAARATDERAQLGGQRAELGNWLGQEKGRQEAVEAFPERVGAFLDDMRAWDTRRAKALLQPILKAAHVYNDGRIELEFRT